MDQKLIELFKVYANEYNLKADSAESDATFEELADYVFSNYEKQGDIILDILCNTEDNKITVDQNISDLLNHHEQEIINLLHSHPIKEAKTEDDLINYISFMEEQDCPFTHEFNIKMYNTLKNLYIGYAIEKLQSIRNTIF